MCSVCCNAGSVGEGFLSPLPPALDRLALEVWEMQDRIAMLKEKLGKEQPAA